MYVWTLPTGTMADASIARRLQPVLSQAEWAESSRFHRSADQQQFIIARALVRFALSSHASVPASAWQLDRDNHRKPYIAGPAISPRLSFSVSHTDGMIACMTTLSPAAAVDVEAVHQCEDLMLVAREALTPAEQESLGALRGRDWAVRFFEYWTLKEAYVKARGLGLGLALSDVGFETTPGSAIRPYFSSRLDDEPAAWAFWSRHLSERHVISVAVKKNFTDACEIIVQPVKLSGARIALDA